MSVAESVAAELDRLGVTDWRREMATSLARKVDDDGAAAAASLLRTLMVEAATEQPTASTAVDLIRASVITVPRGRKRDQKRRAKVPETPPETLPESPETVVSGRACVECGRPLDVNSGGRPRVRHPECRRTRSPRGA